MCSYLENKFDYVHQDETFRYQFLDRLLSDCKYFLGNGNRNPIHLYTKDVKKQINLMKAIWKSFDNSKKPEWLTFNEIENYESMMKE